MLVINRTGSPLTSCLFYFVVLSLRSNVTPIAFVRWPRTLRNYKTVAIIKKQERVFAKRNFFSSQAQRPHLTLMACGRGVAEKQRTLRNYKADKKKYQLVLYLSLTTA
jgi:hypothetical protein